MHPTLVLNIVGLTPELIGPHTPNIARLAHEGGMRPLRTITPAVTCSVQATFLTGLDPSGHGAVANGWLHGAREVGTDSMIAVDGFRLFSNWIFLVAAALGILISLAYVYRQRLQAGEYYGLILLSTAGMMFMAGAPGARVESDGTFAMKNVPPGDYKLQVRTTVDGKTPGAQVQAAAAAVVTVNGVDLSVSLMTTSGGSISGQVLTESGAAPTFQPERMRLFQRPINNDADPRPTPGPGGPGTWSSAPA